MEAIKGFFGCCSADAVATGAANNEVADATLVKEKNVIVSSAPDPTAKTGEPATSFHVGDRVDIFYQADETWCTGFVTAANTDGTYNCLFNDAGRAFNKPLDHLRRDGESSRIEQQQADEAEKNDTTDDAAAPAEADAAEPAVADETEPAAEEQPATLITEEALADIQQLADVGEIVPPESAPEPAVDNEEPAVEPENTEVPKSAPEPETEEPVADDKEEPAPEPETEEPVADDKEEPAPEPETEEPVADDKEEPVAQPDNVEPATTA